ncbi:MAG: glycoside hydrolase family 2 TIM barrel-domain containing protein [Roseibacillus sp.]
MKAHLLFTALPLLHCTTLSLLAETIDFSGDWKFEKTKDDADCSNPAFEDSHWQDVSLPHTANIEPLVVNDQWQGVCWYRKSFDVPSDKAGKQVWLEFEAAMNESSFWLNGEKVADHLGGYLPVVIDISDQVKFGESNTIAVRLDNTDNIYSGPKPLERLDFNMYGGLYRHAHLTYKDPLHITHPILANKEASGGTFLTFPQVSAEQSQVKIQTHLANKSKDNSSFQIRHRILFQEQEAATSKKEDLALDSGQDAEFEETFTLNNAALWSPQSPNLHHLVTEVVVDGQVVDSETTRFGIRRFEFREGHKLFINGEKTFLRGVNRHQEYPFVGYALSDNAQYRDAKKIKDGGFDYVRLSHYPHSPAFMDACDELGLITMNAIMGWQYFLEDERFRNYCYQSTRHLIRRDRNRASVLCWEASLNETKVPEDFLEELHRLVHAEFPGDYVYSASWDNHCHDIFLQARQHRILHNFEVDLSKPYSVSEYGDWEYFSNNAGFHQDKMSKSERAALSSRQLRSAGEKKLHLQTHNVQESHNDNLTTYAFSDSYWVMYDYNRGYYDDLEASGLSDIYRLPKFGYDFYRSQRSPEEGVMVDIASFWTEQSPFDVKVYSNCDEVELVINDKTVARQKPDTDEDCTKLNHPPFTFLFEEFEPGTLTAIAFRDGKEVARDSVTTPGKATRLVAWLDESGRPPQAGVNDVLFLHLAAVDDQAVIVPTFTSEIDLQLEGDAEVLNVGPIVAEAGVATALLRIGSEPGEVRFKASSKELTIIESNFQTGK